jgi:hypothetical protein
MGDSVMFIFGAVTLFVVIISTIWKTPTGGH